MDNTDLLLHKAAQYLASFGIQYLDKLSDDSHTNLDWDADLSALSSRRSKDGQFMRLYLADLRLEWVAGEQCFPLGLEGRSHGEICVWLHHIALRCGKEEYDFYLHYTLDSGKMKSDFIYNSYDSSRAAQLINLRNDAQSTCEAIRAHFDLDTEIRIWPHHFDTGGYAALPGSDINVGFGMAIPDAVVDEYYLYVSGYQKGKAISTEGNKALNYGKWIQGDFTGSVLPLTSTTEEERMAFMKASITQLSV